MKKLTYLTLLPVIAICCTAFVNQTEVLVYVNSSSPKLSSNIPAQIEKLADKVMSGVQSQITSEELLNQEIKSERKPITLVETEKILKIKVEELSVKKAIIKKQRTLVIDAGHGGKDTSTRSITGELEKDLNLRAALILKEEAEKRGINVVMTRESDVYITLRDRVKFQKGADAFISIHHNSISGIMGASVPKERRFKGIEIYFSNSEQSSQNKDFGVKVLNSLKNLKGFPVYDSPKKVGMYVLKEASIPAIAVEMANISYKEGCEFISDKENVRKVCNLILNGVEK